MQCEGMWLLALKVLDKVGDPCKDYKNAWREESNKRERESEHALRTIWVSVGVVSGASWGRTAISE